MAHIDTTIYRRESVDRAPLRTAAHTWHELALATVAWLGIAPALVVGALLILEALLPPAKLCGTAAMPLACTAGAEPPARIEPAGGSGALPLLSLHE